MAFLAYEHRNKHTQHSRAEGRRYAYALGQSERGGYEVAGYKHYYWQDIYRESALNDS